MARAKPRTLRRRILKGLLVILALCPVLALGLWIAIHKIPWLGPLLADSARAIVGPGPIATLEDITYGLQDRWNLYWRGDELPEAYWETPEVAPTEPEIQEPDAPSTQQIPPFHLDNVPPMHKSWSAPGDGVWVPIEDALRPGAPVRMFKTLLHPDRNRSWTAVTVVAADMRQVRLHAVPGRWEPKATEPEGMTYTRTGLIPTSDQDKLLGIFNGGFKYEHGRYGMRVDGVTLVRPRAKSCTIAMSQDDRLEVGTWERFAETHKELRWWRQTPGCMWENGKLHVGLTIDDNTAWGATVDGDTVIRRSAVGVSEDGNVLYVGIGDSTSARSIALAMKHAGAQSVAQLDVNWSFPKFVTVARSEDGGELVCVPISKGFEYDASDFLRKAYPRDFIYLTVRE